MISIKCVAWNMGADRWTPAHLVKDWDDKKTLCGLGVGVNNVSGNEAEDGRGICRQCSIVRKRIDQ